VSLRNRLERALEGLLTPDRVVGMESAVIGTFHEAHSKGFGLDVAPDETEKARLRHIALGLMDPEVRGWLVIVVRENDTGAEVDADARIPESAYGAIGTVLGELVNA
jgi:hypothetical protein